MVQGSPEGTQAHGNLAGLGGFSQRAIDHTGDLSSPRHRGDDQRNTQRAPKKRELGIDLLERKLGQCLVDQADAFQTGRDTRCHVLFQVDLEMICFTRLDSGNFCHHIGFYVANE